MEEFEKAVFYMLLNPYGYSGLSMTLSELMDLEVPTFLRFYERLIERRQEESDAYERAKKG